MFAFICFDKQLYFVILKHNTFYLSIYIPTKEANRNTNCKIYKCRKGLS